MLALHGLAGGSRRRTRSPARRRARYDPGEGVEACLRARTDAPEQAAEHAARSAYNVRPASERLHKHSR